MLILVVLALLWSPVHLGIGVQDPGWLAPIVAAVSAGVALTREFLRRRDRGVLARRIAKLSRSILRPLPITLGYVLFGSVVLTRSSILVIAATPDEERPVTVRPIGDTAHHRRQDTGKEFEPAKFHGLTTSPFGRTYRVEAEGYIPAIVTLRPFAGRQLRLGRDLVISPSVLIRPSRLLLGQIADSARLVVYEVHGERRDSIAGVPPGTPSALLIGREQQITFRPEWIWELADEDEYRRNTTLLQWVRPAVHPPERPLNPGLRLEAVVLSKERARLGEVIFTIRNERLVDVPLRER